MGLSWLSYLCKITTKYSEVGTRRKVTILYNALVPKLCIFSHRLSRQPSIEYKLCSARQNPKREADEPQYEKSRAGLHRRGEATIPHEGGRVW